MIKVTYFLFVLVLLASPVLGYEVLWNDSLNNASKATSLNWTANVANYKSADECTLCPYSLTSTQITSYRIYRPVNDTVESINVPFIYQGYMEFNVTGMSGVYLGVSKAAVSSCTTSTCILWGLYTGSLNRTGSYCIGDAGLAQDNDTLTFNQWYKFSIIFYGDSTGLYLDDTLIHNCTGSRSINWSQAVRVFIGKEQTGTVGSVHVDNVSVLLYEPSNVTVTPINGTLDLPITFSTEPFIQLINTTTEEDCTLCSHNNLLGLQGGAAGEYFHINNSEHTYLVANLYNFSIGNLTAGNDSYARSFIENVTTNNCSNGNYTYGIDPNGTLLCRDDISGGGTDGFWNITTSKYLYNNSGILDTNETELNITINNSIDIRVTQTFIEGLGFNTTSDLKTYFDGFYALIGNVVNTTTNFGGEVSGTYDNIILDNNALDDQYYDSESDLTALLDDNYAPINLVLHDQDLNTTDDVTFTGFNITTNNATVNQYMCFNAGCSAYIYWNGSSLIGVG